MILKLYYEYDTPNGMNIDYQFVNQANGNIFATATDYFNQYITLYVNNDKYLLPNIPKIVKHEELNFKYPLTSKRKKTVGFRIKKNDNFYCHFYGDAAKCKKGILMSNIGFTVFVKDNNLYMLFRVGFKDENDHYYCLYNNNMETIAIIQRHVGREDNCKATIYVENNDEIEMALIACTEELISVPTSNGQEHSMDTSAGNYISILDAEKELLDRDFIARVKQNV